MSYTLEMCRAHELEKLKVLPHRNPCILPMPTNSLLMADIRSRNGKPVPFVYWEDIEDATCVHCDKVFTDTFECGVHESSCKANTAEHVKQYKHQTNKINKKIIREKSSECHICGCTGHLPVNCHVTKHERKNDLPLFRTPYVNEHA